MFSTLSLSSSLSHSSQKYLPLVCDITNETSNWRFRKLMARFVATLSFTTRVRVCVCVCGGAFMNGLLTASGTPQLTTRTTCNNRQLGKLSALYSAPVVNKHLVPISLQLCQDAVSGVRKAAYMSVRYVALCNHPLTLYRHSPPFTPWPLRAGGVHVRWVR
jgi:hypothetical protein